MLGYVVFKDEDCLVQDRVRAVKKFEDETQIFCELNTYFISEESCVALTDKGKEIEIDWLVQKTYNGTRFYDKKEGKNDFFIENC